MWRIHGANYSVSMVFSQDDFSRMKARAVGVLNEEPRGLFPAHYPSTLERRLEFGIGRLAAFAPGPGDAAIRSRLAALAGDTAFDRAAMNVAAYLGFWGRYAALAWLALRLKPFSPMRLAVEPLRRVLAGIASRRIA
jgi:hypothetical protein